MDYLSFYAMCLQSILPDAGLHLCLINVTDGGWDEDGCEIVGKELSHGADPWWGHEEEKEHWLGSALGTCLFLQSQNHRIIKKDFQGHQAQPSTKHHHAH